MAKYLKSNTIKKMNKETKVEYSTNELYDKIVYGREVTIIIIMSSDNNPELINLLIIFLFLSAEVDLVVCVFCKVKEVCLIFCLAFIIFIIF